MFTAGFALREYGAFNYYNTTVNLNIYIASTCLIYMSPQVASPHIQHPHAMYYLLWILADHHWASSPLPGPSSNSPTSTFSAASSTLSPTAPRCTQAAC